MRKLVSNLSRLCRKGGEKGGGRWICSAGIGNWKFGLGGFSLFFLGAGFERTNGKNGQISKCANVWRREGKWGLEWV